ncbi:pentapeptide repeat-containing protein [uncultured Catenibacterium sp.]|uniref:pentapeptide repeat-containing protein n=1 Tax=uncultured Catenibacterium sp. TaxID=286142 RepID=UPI0025D10B75|nr:hypothetical protein [uncultured Catenibacterium sp.]
MTKEQMITSIREVIERYNISEQGFNTRAFNDKAPERIEIKKSELHCNNDEKVKTCMIINCDISDKLEPFRSKMNNYEEISIENADISRAEFVSDQFYKVQFEGGRISGIFINCHFDQAVFNKMTFSNVAFVNCSFDDTVSANSSYKNTYFIGCHYHDLIAEGENDTDTMHEFPFCDVYPSPCEDGTIHHSSNIDEKQVQEELDKQEDEGLPEELIQDANEMFENSDDEENQNVTGFHQQTIDDYPEEEEVETSPDEKESNLETEKNNTEDDEGEENNMEQTVKTETQTIDIEGQTFAQNEFENGFKFKGKRFDKCTFKDIKISEYLPTGAPFNDCIFSNVVFDVAVANMQFANCTFSNVLFTKMVKNVLFEGCDINFSSEQMKEVFTACSYIASEEKRDDTAENIICGEPRTKELSEDEKQALIKEEVEKRVEEERKTAYDEGMKAGIESVQKESESVSMEDLVKSIRNLSECMSEGLLDVVNKAGSLVEKETDKHKTIEKEVVRELTEEEEKDMVIRYIHDNINQVGELITSAQNYKSKESEESESEHGFGDMEK